MDERKGECQGNQDKCNAVGCPLFGTLGRPDRKEVRRIRGCSDPSARGRRNRSKGDEKARRARKKLGLGGHLTRHEENWGGYFRTEVKAGIQVGPIATRFQAAFAQSLASKALGDIRPFIMVAMPDGNSDGIVLMSLSEFAEIASLLREM